MKKKVKYLPMYYAWIKTGMLPSECGLCFEFGKWNKFSQQWNFDSLFELLHPEPYRGGLSDHWAGASSGMFNPLRQNIVLLMAAMNGEL
jgi:hypothetical protein